ncbi:MAG TPA: tripartite tricarboxylate transporter substrate binding protein [Xanthobacteraceae bacterium]|nr:tripartite tricarboxylate transporter substrate binding protein [Xanthobacteraceae bacterium]
MKLPRREFLRLAATVTVLPAGARLARAQAYPTRPVHIVVGFGAGTGLDLYARLIAQWLSDHLGQSFVVDNKPGAGTNVATEYVVNAPPDGYTLLMANTAAFTNAALYDNLRFNFIRDIAPVASLTRGAFVMIVNPAFPAKTIPEFITYAKANPGKINMASGGTGTVTHVAGELFKSMAGIDMLHVPYRNDGAAITDLIAGRVEVYFIALAGAAEFIKTGKVRPLGVTTQARSAAFPDIPTVAEFLPGYEASLRNGLGAPRATPPEVIATLNAEVNAGLNDPKLKGQFADLGSETVPLTPAEYGKIIVAETEKWGKVIRAAGIKISE